MDDFNEHFDKNIKYARSEMNFRYSGRALDRKEVLWVASSVDKIINEIKLLKCMLISVVYMAGDKMDGSVFTL